MWFNEKNAIKKLARNLHNDMKKMNVITIETVKHYDLNLNFRGQKIKCGEESSDHRRWKGWETGGKRVK